MAFTRISVDPSRCGGVPCIRDLRIPVATVVSMVAEGQTHEEIVAELPELELEDIREALRYAAEAVRQRELPLLSNGSLSSSLARFPPPTSPKGFPTPPMACLRYHRGRHPREP